MADIHFGSIDSRELHLRFFAPQAFYAWDGRDFRLSVWRLLNPRRWLKAAICRCSWRIWCKRWSGMNHRCYCQTGVMCDGTVVLCGFGMLWFYSRFDGDIPCWCDRALENL